MQFEEILKLAEQKMKQLGFTKYTVRNRTFSILPDTLLEQKGYAEYWFLKDNQHGLTVRSDYGLSGNEIPSTNELINHHTGLIEIRNNTNKSMKVEFLQVLPINR